MPPRATARRSTHGGSAGGMSGDASCGRPQRGCARFRAAVGRPSRPKSTSQTFSPSARLEVRTARRVEIVWTGETGEPGSVRRVAASRGAPCTEAAILPEVTPVKSPAGRSGRETSEGVRDARPNLRADGPAYVGVFRHSGRGAAVVGTARAMRACRRGRRGRSCSVKPPAAGGRRFGEGARGRRDPARGSVAGASLTARLRRRVVE